MMALRRARAVEAAPPFVVRALGDLGDDLTWSPERALLHATGATGRTAATTIALGDLVTERSDRVPRAALAGACVLDTTHARDGVIDWTAAARLAATAPPPASAKKGVVEGDLLVSRLRPYLRQIAYVEPRSMPAAGGRRARVACSTEFHVLRARDDDDDVAWLLPWFLSDAVQERLSAAQEGGHHPRVARESLFALRVPRALHERRAATSRRVRAALRALYRARADVDRVLARRAR